MPLATAIKHNMVTMIMIIIIQIITVSLDLDHSLVTKLWYNDLVYMGLNCH